MIVIADTGPLLALAKINALDLLEKLYHKIIICPVVYDEAITQGFASGASDAKVLNEAYNERERI
ncbi:MAG: hypothetical protein B6242_15380 [Anaerolineaceae bacterium 4572_78]|nr:MAG: hypothetical protein B6242_15380 [Anaerolineaceae bacterium 4572_78]